MRAIAAHKRCPGADDVYFEHDYPPKAASEKLAPGQYFRNFSKLEPTETFVNNRPDAGTFHEIFNYDIYAANRGKK